MLKPHPLNERHRFKGHWSRANDKEHKVAGTFTFEPSGTPHLDLFGSLRRSPFREAFIDDVSGSGDSGDIEIVHGTAHEVPGVTLFNVQTMNTSIQSYGSSLSSYFVPVALVGFCLFENDADVDCKVFELRLTGLDEWASEYPMTSDKDGKTWSFHFTATEGFKVDVPAEQCAISVVRRASTSNSRKRFLLEHPTILRIESFKSMNLDDLINVVGKLQTIFTLFYCNPVRVWEARGYAENVKSSKEPEKVLDPKKHPFDMLMAQPRAGLYKDLSRREVLLSEATIRPYLAAMLPNFFASYAKLRQVYESFVLSHNSRHVGLELRFLIIMQAIESFHRTTIGGTYTDTDQFEAIRVALVNAIPQGIDEGLRSKIKNGVKWMNDPSLRRRLLELLRTLEQESRDMICPTPDVFIGAVVDTRNYFTHLDKQDDSQAMEGDKLFRAVFKVECLLALLLLKHLGLPESVFRKACNSREMYRTPW